MKMNRLATALTLSLFAATSAQAAKYRVVEIPLTEQGVNSFSAKINNNGEVAALVQQPKNPPIDVELVNFDDDFLVNNLTDSNAAEVGNINTDDLLVLFTYVRALSDSPFSQKLADTHSYLFDNTDVQFLPAFDRIDSDLEGYTFSVDIIVRGINDSTALVGTSSAPYSKVDYQDESGNDLTYVTQEHSTRGFIEISGQTFPVMPPETTMGGISEAYDINNGFEVAGYASVETSAAFEQLAEDCQDDLVRNDVPEEACFQAFFDADTFSSNFQRRAMIWQFDSAGNLLDERELGLLLTQDESETRNFLSIANAINENGIAVGQSSDFYREDTTLVSSFAAIFDGDDVVGFTDQQEYVSSVASDINNNDIVVGHAFTCNTFTEGALNCVQGSEQSHFYYHDYRGEFTQYPEGFFDSSSSIARAINDNGLIVGEAEVDANVTGTRRREGFLYDINDDSFQNINDLLSCDTPYNIVQVNDINNNDEITATAVIFRERTNITGEVDLDDRGNVIEEGMSVAVKLIPIPGGAVDDCRLIPETLERQGGSPGPWLLLLLSVVGWLRMRKSR